MTLPGAPPGPALPEAFEVIGRIAIRTAAEATSGRVQWRHSRDQDDLLMSSPTGQGVARITRSGAEVSLTRADGTVQRASEIESLTEQALGYRLPLRGLADWIQGRPDPTRPAESRADASARVVEIAQDGWRIEYSEFSQGRPSRLRMAREQLEIRLVIEEWAKHP